MNEITIKQIFINCNLIAGEQGLQKRLESWGRSRTELEAGKVFVFINRKKSIIKVLGRKGMIVDRFNPPIHDFSMHKDKILETVGKYFNIHLKMSNSIHKELMEIAFNKTVNE
jgi:hypothetical protein